MWAFWPPSMESQYHRGAALMASPNPDDWETAWTDYLEPLEKKHPDNVHKEEINRFYQQLEAYRAGRDAWRKARRAGPMTEAQWFYQEGSAATAARQREGCPQDLGLAGESIPAGAVRGRLGQIGPGAPGGRAHGRSAAGSRPRRPGHGANCATRGRKPGPTPSCRRSRSFTATIRKPRRSSRESKRRAGSRIRGRPPEDVTAACQIGVERPPSARRSCHGS